MFENFVTFGHIDLDVSDIYMVVWEWVQGTIELPSGLTDFGDTDKLKGVGLMFRNGSQVRIEGDDAVLFREYWLAVREPFGDVM